MSEIYTKKLDEMSSIDLNDPSQPAFSDILLHRAPAIAFSAQVA
jgi:hypothetical protein